MFVDVLYPHTDGTVRLRLSEPDGHFSIKAHLCKESGNETFLGYASYRDPALCLESIRFSLNENLPTGMHRAGLLLAWDILNVWDTNG